VISNKQKF